MGLRELQDGHKVLGQDYLVKLYDQPWYFEPRDGFCGRDFYFLRVFFYLFEFVPFILLQEKIEAVQ